MSLRVRSLASGSSGNAFLLWSAGGALLIDAGLPARTLERQLRLHDVSPSHLTAIVVSHEHHDHAQGAGPLARRYGVPIVCTAGTAGALRESLAGVEIQLLHEAGITVGDVDLWSFPVPHDAVEPCGILLRHAQCSVGFALDLGHAPTHVADALRQADLIVLESNHDREKLIRTPYPWSTKHRIMGDRGHLSNLQAAQLLAQIAADGRPRDVWLAHLSEKANDHPPGVIRCVANYLDVLGITTLRLDVAQRNRPSATWHSDQAMRQADLFTCL
jgi:phosphoribosyl 1,2-cyclic phosphodiesterase